MDFFYSFWWVMIPGLLLGGIAQLRLMSTYKKYVKVGASTGTTGAEAARQILDRSGLASVPVREVRGHLTDHYDPLKKALYLSSENYHGRSLAAVGVAAHEAGHALQQKAAYAPLQLRMMLVPATQFASSAYLPIIILGFVLGGTVLGWALTLVIGIFAVITLFQLVTLPVEFDASSRAKNQLVRLGIVKQGETAGVSKVLNAAALTYVAAMVTALLQLMYFIMLARD